MSDRFSKYAVTPEQVEEYKRSRNQDRFAKYAVSEDEANRYKQEHESPIDEETKGFSGIAKDALHKSIRTAFGIPSALMNLPTEGYGAVKQLTTNYPRYAANAVGGFGELGHNILSSPGALRDYLVKKDLLSSKSPSFRLPESVLPKEFNYAEALGAKGHQAGDELIRGGATGLASMPLANKIFSAAESLPLSRTMAARPLVAAEKLIGERNVNKIKIPKDILKEAKDFLPKNLPTKNLLEQAAKGDYKSLFTLQSDLRKAGSGLTKSASGAERLYGIQAHDLRQRLLNAFKDDLTKKGHNDIVGLISKGQNKYRQYMKLTGIVKPIAKWAGVPIGTGALIGAGIKGFNSLTKD